MKLVSLIRRVQSYATGYVEQLHELLLLPFEKIVRDRFAERIKLGPGLWIFVVVSVFAGTVLGELGNIRVAGEGAETYVGALAFWFACTSWALLVIRILRGIAGFSRSLASTLYVLSAIFLVVNLVAFIVDILTKRLHDMNLLLKAGAYTALPLLLLAIYLPPVLACQNRLRSWKLVLLVALVPIPLILLTCVVIWAMIVAHSLQFPF